MIVTRYFGEFFNRVIALYLRQNFVYAQYLENRSVEFHQIIYMHLYLQDLAWDGTRHFSHINTRVKALDLCQNFVSAQYFENKLTDFHQIVYMHSY